MRVISFDFETYYDANFGVVELGYDRYARDPRCAPYLVSVSDGSENWAGSPADFNFDSLAGATLLSHNAAFDEEIALGAAERGDFVLPGLKREGMDHWLCTLNMSSYLWNVRSLADATRIGLGISVDKGVRDRAKGKTPDDMKREGWWDEMLKYGRHDAQYCWQLYAKHGHKWPELERRLSRLTIDQGRHGVKIDVEALQLGISYLQRVIFTAEQNLPWVKRGRKPASPIGIAEECAINRIPPPPVKAHDPEKAQEWEDTYAPQFQFVLALRNLRKAKKTLATLETIRLRLRPDDTVAFSLKYAGAHTLRWAGDSGWNLQNMNKEPLFFDENWSFVLDKKKTSELAARFDKEIAGRAAVGELGTIKFFDMRGIIVAREGMALAPVDEAQIEPRVLNTMAGNMPLLEKIRSGLAIYEAHARETMPEAASYAAPLKETGKKLYALAKARVLGLGYGCGWEKFITVAQMMAGIDITEGDEEFALRAAVDGKIHRRRRKLSGKDWSYDGYYVLCTDEGRKFVFGPEKVDPADANIENPHPWQDFVFIRVMRWDRTERREREAITPVSVYGMRSRVTVEEFRRTNPLIVALWENLQQAIEDSVGEDLVIEGPHGGCLIYRDVRVEKRKKVDKETGEEYEKTCYTALIGGKRYVIYGGLLCENFIQWLSRMVFAERMLDLHDRLKQEDPRQGVLFSVHDEAVPEILAPADRKARARQIEEIMAISPAWLQECPLGAECKVVDRYLK